MKLSIITTYAALAISQASAHMAMIDPPPLRSKYNPNSGDEIDYSITSPLNGTGADYPCRGALSVLGTDKAKPVADYAPGQQYSITIEGGAYHKGGSCQISLSYDQGKSFSTIKSIVGNCPGQGTSKFPFTIPAEASSGNPLLAWTWYNRIGNRELYMNCASVTIGGGGGGGDGASSSGNSDTAQVNSGQASTPLSSRQPPIFLANIGNGCESVEPAFDLEFPNPGPDVVYNSEKNGTKLPSCKVASAPATGGDSGSGSSSGSPAPVNGGSASSPDNGGAVYYSPENGGAASSPDNGGASAPAPSTPPATTAAPPAAAPPAAPPASCEPSGDSGSASPPATSLEPGSGSGTGSSSGSVAGAQTGACTNEGIWNCIGGNQFQRCASGQWSVVMSMAAGTSCSPGESDKPFAKKRLRFMRW